MFNIISSKFHWSRNMILLCLMLLRLLIMLYFKRLYKTGKIFKIRNYTMIVFVLIYFNLIPCLSKYQIHNFIYVLSKLFRFYTMLIWGLNIWDIQQAHTENHESASLPCPECTHIAKSKFRLTKHIYSKHRWVVRSWFKSQYL